MFIKKILIIGAGLLGGSIIKKIHRDYPNVKIEVVVRDPHKYKMLENYAEKVWDIEKLPKKGDWEIVVAATPVLTIAPCLLKIAPLCEPNCILTDVGSSKKEIADSLKDLPNYIGSHPMAGKEKGGFEESSADLFVNKVTVICPNASTPPLLLEKLTDFWRALGSYTVFYPAEEHDRIVSYASHLPHALSFVFAAMGEELFHSKKNLFFGNSFSDFSRIAQSDPHLWIEIFQSNKKNLIFFTENFIKFLTAFKQHLEEEDWGKIKIMLENAHQFLKE